MHSRFRITLAVVVLIIFSATLAQAQSPTEYCWGGAKGAESLEESLEGLKILIGLVMLFFAGYYPGQP